MTTSVGTGTRYGCPFVVATSLDEALGVVQEYLADHKIGFPADRELESIELLADESEHPLCSDQLFVVEPK
jgi:hypothetical protein